MRITTTSWWMTWRLPTPVLWSIQCLQQGLNFLEFRLQLSKGFELFLQLLLTLL